MMSKPSTRKQVVVLCQRLRFPSGGNAPPTVEECLDEILRTDAALRDEGGRLKAEVREWLCTTCHFVYPGPPQEGVACVVCPRCGGDCGPRLSMNVRDLRIENELLGNLLEHADDFTPQLVERDTRIANLTAQLATVTQERDAAFKAYELALAARERAVWLEAAKMAKTFSKGYEVDWLRISTKGEISRQVCIDIAELIREQAKKEQP